MSTIEIAVNSLQDKQLSYLFLTEFMGFKPDVRDGAIYFKDDQGRRIHGIPLTDRAICCHGSANWDIGGVHEFFLSEHCDEKPVYGIDNPARGGRHLKEDIVVRALLRKFGETVVLPAVLMS